VGGHCQSAFKLTDIYYATTAVNIATDWFCALLPLPLLWNVPMNPQAKISVAILLSMGSLASISACVRLKYTVALTSTHDYLYSLGDLVIWGCECNLKHRKPAQTSQAADFSPHRRRSGHRILRRLPQHPTPALLPTPPPRWLHPARPARPQSRDGHREAALERGRDGPVAGVLQREPGGPRDRRHLRQQKHPAVFAAPPRGVDV